MVESWSTFQLPGSEEPVVATRTDNGQPGTVFAGTFEGEASFTVAADYFSYAIVEKSGDKSSAGSPTGLLPDHPVFLEYAGIEDFVLDDEMNSSGPADAVPCTRNESKTGGSTPGSLIADSVEPGSSMDDLPDGLLDLESPMIASEIFDPVLGMADILEALISAEPLELATIDHKKTPLDDFQRLDQGSSMGPIPETTVTRPLATSAMLQVCRQRGTLVATKHEPQLVGILNEQLHEDEAMLQKISAKTNRQIRMKKRTQQQALSNSRKLVLKSNLKSGNKICIKPLRSLHSSSQQQKIAPLATKAAPGSKKATNTAEEGKMERLLRNRVSVTRCRDKKRQKVEDQEAVKEILMRENSLLQSVITEIENSGLPIPKDYYKPKSR